MPRTNIKSKKVAVPLGDSGPASPALLGGKGAGLMELARLGVPVPAGFTITTSVARAFAQHEKVPSRMAHQLTWSIKALENETGKTFGGSKNPLLVSVRSGAAVSMPGMMDSILNLGINPQVANGLARRTNTRFAYDCYRRFLQMFGAVVLKVERTRFEEILDRVKQRRGVSDDRHLDGGAMQEVCNRFRLLIKEATGNPVPDDARQQLEMAIMAVLESWQNPRAIEYRRINRIANGMGTAVNVVSMVYGNRDQFSGTGVVFSRNVATGENGIWGEFLANAQGEDVVAGTRTPEPIAALRQALPVAYGELVEIVEMLEQRRGHVVDIEFTVETGRLYILQVRRAKLSPEAAVTIAVHNIWHGLATKQTAIAGVAADHIEAVQNRTFEPKAYAVALATRQLAVGLSASPGCAVGRVVRSSNEAVAAKKRGETVILVRPDTCPEDLPGMIAAAAIVTMTGGYSSHAAVVARDLGKPCIVNASALSVREGTVISVDGQTGAIMSGAVALTGAAMKKEVNLFLKWLSEVSTGKWRKPRLVFDLYNQVRSANVMISDFYLAEVMAHAAQGSRLQSRTKTMRTRIHMEVAERLALYLVIAVGGEVRHAKTDWVATSKETQALASEFDTEYGGRERAKAQVKTLSKLKTVGLAQQIRYLELAVAVFENGSWGMSVGGRKWAAIAKAALAFLKGEYSHSVFADHAFDLQHNGGCVFGKNPMISANRTDVRSQLEDKKYTSDVAQLYRIGQRYFREPENVYDHELEELYREGAQLGLWGTTTVGGTSRWRNGGREY